MSPLSWLFLLVIYFLNLIVGMYIFHGTECPKELEDMRARHKEDIKLTALVQKMENMMVGNVYEELEEILEPGEMEELVRIWSGRGVTMLEEKAGNSSEADDTDIICVKWDKLNSFFFAFTAVTTIGKKNVLSNSFNPFPSLGYGTDLASCFSHLQATATRHQAPWRVGCTASSTPSLGFPSTPSSSALLPLSSPSR